MVKTESRADARAARRAVTGEARADKEARIRQHALSMPEMQRARVVGCYVSIGSEVDTRMLLRELLARSVVVAVPVIEGDHLRFVRLDHPWALVAGPRGVPIPRQPWSDVGGDRMDVIVVPGLRFGRDGSRLGNGGGHFDRYLHDHPNPLRVALAFSEQVVDHVPTELHDQGVDVLVTEDGRHRAGRPA